jgi:hypothetical protein
MQITKRFSPLSISSIYGEITSVIQCDKYYLGKRILETPWDKREQAQLYLREVIQEKLHRGYGWS